MVDFHFHKRDAVLPLKVMATICLGRYSGLVSFSLSQDKHPADVEPKDRKTMIPASAIVGGACSMAVIFLVKSKHRFRNLGWFLVGSVPIGMGLSAPFCDYALKGCSKSDWYKFKTLHSLVAFGIFSLCTLQLALED